MPEPDRYGVMARRLLAAAALFVVIGIQREAPAATYSWSGLGLDGFWDSGANWIGGVPPDYSLLPTTLQFSGTARTTAVNRTPSPLVAFIDFANDNSDGRTGAFTLSGSAVRLDPQSRITTAALVNSGTITDTIALPLIMQGGLTVALGGSAQAVHNLTIAGGVSGSGTLSSTGSFGTLTLSGSNTYSGSTWVRGGTLLVPAGGALTGGSQIRVGVAPGENAAFRVDGGLVVSSTASIASGEPNVGTATVSSGTWINTGWFDVGRTGTGTLNIVGTGVVTVGGGTGTLMLAPLGLGARSTLNLGDGTAAGTLRAAVVGGTSAAGAQVNFNHSMGAYAFAPAIVGDVAVTHLGSGRTVLSGSNLYTGTASVQAGTLQFARTASMPFMSGTPSPRFTVAGYTTAASGATLALNVGGAGEFTAREIDWLKGLGTGTSGFLNGSTLGLDTTNAAGGTFTYASSIANPNGGSNALGVSKLGAGTLVLSGNNTFTGGVTVQDGTLVIGYPRALGAGTVTVRGGTLAVGSSSSPVYAAGVVLSGGAITGTTRLASASTFDMRSGVASVSLTGQTGLTKTTSGTVILTGSNTYTGPTMVQEGTLLFGGTAALYGGATGAWTAANLATGSGATLALAVGGSGQFTAANVAQLATLGTGTSGFLNGSTLGFDTTNAAGGTFTYASSIANPNGGANALGVSKLGAGTLVLSGTNTFTGGVTVQEGTLLAGSSGALGAGTVTVRGGVLTIGAGSKPVYIYRSAFVLAGGTVTGTTPLGSTGTFDVRSGVASASLTGSAGLTKTTSGTVLLTGSNTYTGPTVVQEGTLQLGRPVSLSYGFATTGSGATLALNVGGAGEFTAQEIDWLKGLGTGTSGFLNGSTLGLDTTNAAGGTFTYASSIANPNGGANALGLSKLGAGTLVLSGNNTFTGGVTVQEGTLLAGSYGALGAGTVTVRGGVLAVGAPQQVSVAGLVLSGGTVTGNTTTSLLSSRTFDVRSGVASASLTGSAGLTKTTSGTVLLTGSNTYTGPTVVQEGTLLFGGTAALYGGATGAWTAANLTTGSGATLALAVGGSGQFTAANVAQLATLGTGTSGFLNGSTLGLDTTAAVGGTFAYTGNLTNPNRGANSLGIAKLGAGTLVLGGTNTYTGPAVVAAGTLHFAAKAALPYVSDGSGALAPKFTVQPGATLAMSAGGAGRFTADDVSYIASLGGTSSGFMSGAILGIDTTGLVDGFVMGVIPNANKGASVLGLTKMGSGRLVLTGSNSYTGPTRIASGTLVVANPYALAGTTLDMNALDTGVISQTSGQSPFIIGGLKGSRPLELLGPATDFGRNGENTTFTGNLTGSNSLIKSGSGTLTLSGSNSYTGTTKVAAGTLQFGRPAALYGGNTTAWTGSNITAFTGSRLAFNVGGTDEFTAANIGSLVSATGPNSPFYYGGSLGLDTTNAAGGLFELQGQFSNPDIGQLAVTKLGAGTLLLSGLNVATGPTRVVAGTLQARGPAALYGGNAGAWTAANITVERGSTFAINVGGTGQFTSANVSQLAAMGTGSSGFLDGASLGLDTSDAVGMSFAHQENLTNPNQGLNRLGLTKLGSGTLRLTGSNTYTGPTRVDGGTLVFSRPAAFYASLSDWGGAQLSTGSDGILAISVAGEGFSADQVGKIATIGSSRSGECLMLGLDTPSLFSYSPSLADPASGPLGIAKLGAGMLVLAGSNAYTGPTRSVSGTLVVAHGSALAGSTLDMRATDTGSVVLSATTSTYAIGGLAGSRPLTVPLQGLTVGGNSQTTVYSGALIGSGSLTKTGNGTLTLSGSSGYSGRTTVAAGTLLLATPTSLYGGTTAAWTTTNIVTGSGATLALRVGGTTGFSAEQAAMVASLGSASGGFLNGSTLGLDTSDAAGGTFVYPTAINNTSGTANARGLTKLGSGTLVLAGTNGYTGPTRVVGGALHLPWATSLYAGNTRSWTAANIVTGSGAMLTLNVSDTGFEFTSPQVSQIAALGTPTGGFAPGALLGLDTTNAIGGIFSHASGIANPNLGENQLGVVKLGSGTLALYGFNTYSGPTRVTAGTLYLGHRFTLNGGTTAAWTAQNLTVESGATLSLAVGGNWQGFEQFSSADVAALTALGSGSSGFRDGSMLGIDVAGGLSFTQDVGLRNPNGGLNSISLIKSGVGTLVLSGSNSFTGTTRIAAGTLRLSNPNALAGSTLDLNAADTGSLSYNVSSGTVNIGGLTGSRRFDVPGSWNTPVAVGGNGQNTTFSGTLAGSGQFIKQGAGTLTLSGSSPAFTAKTAIDAGTLAVNGSLANSPVTVNAGGRLAGTGVVGTTTVNAGGTLMPGNSPGTLTVSGGLTFASGGNYNWQIHDAAGTAGASIGWDLVNVGGVLDVSATTESPFNINLWSLSGVGPDSNGAAVNFNPAASGTWTIATAAAGITNFDAGKFAVNVSAAHDAGGFTNALDGGTFRLVQQGNDLNIVFTPKMIPNPSTLTWYGDGVHPGGSGVWTTTGANWFDGTAVRPWVPGARAVFSGSGGTVTLGEAVAANGGLAFTATGYTVAGVGLTLGGTANAVDVAAGASATLAAPLAGTAGLTKAGPGTLSLAAANTIGGAMVVQTGTVVVASPAATAASTVRVQAGGAVKIEPGVTMRAPSLTLDGGRLDAAGATLLVSGTGGIGQFVIASGTVAGAPGLVVSGSGQVSLPTNIRQVVNLSSLAIDQATGGKLDIGKGRINVAPGGIAEADLRADLIAGRGTGSFSGTAGIVTTGGKASETSANPVVGYRVLTSGSAIVAWAAYGDTNLDGLVNSSDIGLIIAGGKFGKGTGAVWVQGDFTYSGNVNSTDISLLSQSGLYGKGSYLPPASLSVTLADDVRPLVTTEFLSGPIGMTIMAAVPEPSTIVLAAAGVCLTVAFRMGRRRSASKQS